MPSKKNPDPDWDDVITRFIGQDFAGCFTDGQRLEFNFKSGRTFTLSGDGQRHSYELKGEAEGKLEGAEAVKCTAEESEEGWLSTYVGRLKSASGELYFTATRQTKARPNEGFRFKFASEKRAPEPKTDGKPKLSARVG